MEMNYITGTKYFKNGNMRCRLKERTTGGCDGNPINDYQVAIIEIREYGVEVCYLEWFAEFEEAVQGILEHGFCGCDEFDISADEEMYWIESCI